MMKKMSIVVSATIAIGTPAFATGDNPFEQVRAIGGTYGICATAADAVSDAVARAQCERRR